MLSLSRTFTMLAAAAVWLAPASFAHAEQEVPNLGERIQKYEELTPLEESLTEAELKVLEYGMQLIEEKLENPGLEVGTKAPDFTLPNAYGKDVHLYDVLKEGPVVLTFYRGSWCPYCNLELYALQQSLPAFKEQGARLLAVTPQKTEFSLKQVEDKKFDFELLSDLDSSVMKSYNLYYEIPEDLNKLFLDRIELDVAYYNGDGRYVLPVPGTFVINKDGMVTAAFADVDYSKRMEPADIVEALSKL